MQMTLDAQPHLEQSIAAARACFIADCTQSVAILLPVIAQAQDAPQAELNAQLLLAQCYWALDDSVAGHTALDRAETLIKSQKSPRQHAEYEHARAQLLLSSNQYLAALKLWMSCLKKALPLHAYDLYVHACIGIGNIYCAYQQYGDALHWHEMALEFAPHSQQYELLANSYLHVAADLNLLGEYEIALSLSTQGEEIFLSSQHKAWLAEWYSYRGEAHLELAEYTQAKTWLHTAWDLNQKLNYRWCQANNLLALGRVYMATQEPQSAKQYLLMALNLIQSFESNPLRLKAYHLLAQLGEEIADFKMAWEYRRQYQHLALQDAQQIAKDKITSALERRMKELDIQLLFLQTRQENIILRQKSSADSELLSSLRSATLQDPLTGLSNRRHLEQEMPRMYQRCIEEQRPFSVLMVDLDHFKHINDRFGHPIGDIVIQNTAQILLQSCRSGDLIVRYGGEEFVLLLPGAAGNTASEIAERIRQRVETHSWQDSHIDLRVSASIGAAEYHDEPDAQTLIKHADQALYQAKHLGRNRVELYR
ncbi:GGDEF domain-containing protein [Deefgea piscis]|uniref:diguanylate cyclase n=1 Tax=Deefgea piscis TaxID=2739061 RepID=A0A6M8SND8_9NEIS|nr:GGDEF domain-containing protein [Deefgea piscis]QKJ65694.1 GGDEF domain-containing protein [Deefgea piscis]